MSRAISLTGAFGVPEPAKEAERPGSSGHVLDQLLRAAQRQLEPSQSLLALANRGHAADLLPAPHNSATQSGWQGAGSAGGPKAVVREFPADAQPRVWAGKAPHADMRCTCGHKHTMHAMRHGLEKCDACTCPGFELEPMSYCSCGHRLGAHAAILTQGGDLDSQCIGLSCDCDTFTFVPDMAMCDCGHVLCQHDDDGPYSECSECSCLGWQPRTSKSHADGVQDIMSATITLDASALERAGQRMAESMQGALLPKLFGFPAVTIPDVPEHTAALATGDAAKLAQAQARLELIVKMASTTGLSPQAVKAMVDDMVAKGEL